MVTSWSAESAFWMTTRPRAVTAEALVLTTRRTFNRPGLPGRLGQLAELGQAPGQQPRDVHLADPEPRGDLRLGQPVEEPQVQDPLLPVRQLGQQRRQRGSTLGVVQLGVVLAEVGSHAVV